MENLTKYNDKEFQNNDYNFIQDHNDEEDCDNIEEYHYGDDENFMEDYYNERVCAYLNSLIESLEVSTSFTRSAMERLVKIFRSYTKIDLKVYDRFYDNINKKIINFVLHLKKKELENLEKLMARKKLKLIEIDYEDPDMYIYHLYSIIENNTFIIKSAYDIYRNTIENYFLNFIKLCTHESHPLVTLNTVCYVENLLFNTKISRLICINEKEDLICNFKCICMHNYFKNKLSNEVYDYIALFINNFLINLVSRSLMLKDEIIFNDTYFIPIVLELFYNLESYNRFNMSIKNYINRESKYIHPRHDLALLNFNVLCTERILSRYFKLSDFTDRMVVTFTIALEQVLIYLIRLFIDHVTSEDELSLEEVKGFIKKDTNFLNLFRNIGMNIGVDHVFMEDNSEIYLCDDAEIGSSNEFVVDDIREIDKNEILKKDKSSLEWCISEFKNKNGYREYCPGTYSYQTDEL